MEITIRKIVTTSPTGKAYLVEMDSPDPGARLWLPVRHVKFKTRQYMTESDNRLADIPKWLYDKEFREDREKEKDNIAF